MENRCTSDQVRIWMVKSERKQREDKREEEEEEEEEE